MTTRIKSTSKYKALIAVGLDEAAAMKVLTGAKQNAEVDKLVAAGFTPEDAERILANGYTAIEPVAETVTEPAKTAKETATEYNEALVAQNGRTFARGRVYINEAVVEGVVRVLKTGSSEIVNTSGVGRTKAVLVAREESGDVSIQNLA